MLWPSAGTRFWCSTTSRAASARTWPEPSRRARGSPSSTCPTPGRSSRRSGPSSRDSVFHLAAQIDVRRSMADPGFDARLNVVGTVNVLEGAARADASRLVFTSTGGAIYGEGAERPGELPFAETSPCEPFSVYGQSKLAAEGYVDLYGRTRGSLRRARFASGNVYGPRQDPATEAGVVAIFCGLAREGGRPTVFGTGMQTRDYIHVADVVDGLLAMEGSEESGPVNAGTGVETTVLELAERIGRAVRPRRLRAGDRAGAPGRDRAHRARHEARPPSGSAGARSARSPTDSPRRSRLRPDHL